LLTQKALLPFIRHRLDNHLVWLRDQMQDRLTAALHTLQRYAPAEVTWQAPEGGLNVWLKLPPSVDIAELGRLADQEGISFLPGAVCYAGGMDSNHIRISFSYTAKETLEAGLRKLCLLLGELLDRSVIVERKPIL
jgi:DNA-binding transcriptional MocR family regulator